MITDDLNQLRQVIRDEIKPLETKIGTLEMTVEAVKADQQSLRTDMQAGFQEVNKKIETLEMKIETAHAYQQKAHTEIMDILVEGQEANGQEQKKVETRVERIEHHLGLAPMH